MAERIEVVSAVILRDGRVLLTQRDPARSDFGMLWECPGGKVEAGETFSAALARECREELDVLIYEHRWLGSFDLDPPAVRAPLRVTFFCVDIGSQTPTPREAIGIGWFGPELVELPMLPANYLFRHRLAALLRSGQ